MRKHFCASDLTFLMSCPLARPLDSKIDGRDVITSAGDR